MTCLTHHHVNTSCAASSHDNGVIVLHRVLSWARPPEAYFIPQSAHVSLALKGLGPVPEHPSTIMAARDHHHGPHQHVPWNAITSAVHSTQTI